jgi:hypothetical protein
MHNFRYKVYESTSIKAVENWLNSVAIEGYVLDKFAVGESRIAAVVKKEIPPMTPDEKMAQT